MTCSWDNTASNISSSRIAAAEAAAVAEVDIVAVGPGAKLQVVGVPQRIGEEEIGNPFAPLVVHVHGLWLAIDVKMKRAASMQAAENDVMPGALGIMIVGVHGKNEAVVLGHSTQAYGERPVPRVRDAKRKLPVVGPVVKAANDGSTGHGPDPDRDRSALQVAEVVARNRHVARAVKMQCPRCICFQGPVVR